VKKVLSVNFYRQTINSGAVILTFKDACSEAAL
jgi:hypothetical protein